MYGATGHGRQGFKATAAFQPLNAAPYVDPSAIRCIVFDFASTLSSDRYFSVAPPGCPRWRDIIQEHVFDRPAVIDAWMIGDLRLNDIARIVTRYVDLPLS